MVEKRIGCLFNIYLGFLNFLLLPRGISEQLKHRPGRCTAQEIRIAQHGGVPMCKETIRTLIFPGEETLVNLFHCIRPDRVISYVEWLPVGRSDGSEEEAPGQRAIPLHWSPQWGPQMKTSMMFIAIHEGPCAKSKSIANSLRGLSPLFQN